jgi:hypothetical protein
MEKTETKRQAGPAGNPTELKNPAGAYVEAWLGYRIAAQDQGAASNTIFCARQLRSSATYSSFSDGQAIS